MRSRMSEASSRTTASSVRTVFWCSSKWHGNADLMRRMADADVDLVVTIYRNHHVKDEGEE